MARYKRVFAALVALAMTAVCFTACSGDDKDSSSASSVAESVTESSTAEDEEASTEKESSEADASETESSEEESSEEESSEEESVTDDSTVSDNGSGETIEIFLPAYCASDIDLEELEEDSDIQDYTVHEDGSVTYVFDAEEYAAYLSEFRAQIETAIQDEVLPACETITAIDADDDLVDIAVHVSSQAEYEASEADPYVLSVVGNSYSGLYQIMAGNGADWEAVYHIVDDTTGQEFDTLIFDAASLEEMLAAASAEE